LAVLVAALVVACGGPVANKDTVGSRTTVDSLGRSVKLPERIERAVSLAPSITELIFAAGAGDRLVGVTSYCDYPAEARSIAKIGDTQTPNIEAIVALKPQIVFVSTASQLQAFTGVLQQQNISVYILDVKGFDDVPDRLRQLGELFGTSRRSNEAAAELERRVRSIDETVKGNEPVRVFLQISKDPLFTIGRDSFLTAVLAHAGGVSVTSDVASAYPKLNKETALALKPDVIILSDSEDNREPNDAFRDSPAVKNGRIYRINADIISRPGPRLVDAIEQIAGFLGGP
jgi:ABC-type Fe3+-hydroxamate transport system substrate-binding protein